MDALATLDKLSGQRADAFNAYRRWATDKGIYSATDEYTHIILMFDLLSEFMGNTEDEAKDYIRKMLEERHPNSATVSIRKYSLLFNRVLADELLVGINRTIGAFIDVKEQVSFVVTYKQVRLRIQDHWIDDPYQYQGVMGFHTNYLVYDCILNELKLRLNYKISPVLSYRQSSHAGEPSIYQVSDEALKHLDPTLTGDNISQELRDAMRLANTLMAFIHEQIPQAQTLISIDKSKVLLSFRVDHNSQWRLLDDDAQLVPLMSHKMRQYQESFSDYDGA